ncbi:hypothetical protein PVAP13_7KG245455, partial [Panicum virgatum]
CASSSGPWEDRLLPVGSQGTRSLEATSSRCILGRPSLACPRRFAMNGAPCGSYIHDFVMEGCFELLVLAFPLLLLIISTIFHSYRPVMILAEMIA